MAIYRIILAFCFLFAGSALCFGAADEGESLFKNKCGSCHSINKSKSKAKSEKDWRSTVMRMVGHGADLSRQEIDLVVSYLSQNYPAK